MRWLFIALLAGCTTHNPKFEKGDLGSTQGPGQDASASGDAAIPVAIDAAMAQSCTSGMRSCGATGSETCTDGTFVADRTCPLDSACGNGYCVEPTGARSCTTQGFTSEALCATNSGGMNTGLLACQPFVQNGALVWACAPPIGMGGDNSSCTTGSQCRSGICASNGFCFRACAMDADCGKQGNATVCRDLTITVEGVTTSARGCVSPT